MWIALGFWRTVPQLAVCAGIQVVSQALSSTYAFAPPPPTPPPSPAPSLCLSPFSFRLSSFAFAPLPPSPAPSLRLSPFAFRLSLFLFHLSLFHLSLSPFPFAFRLSPFTVNSDLTNRPTTHPPTNTNNAPMLCAQALAAPFLMENWQGYLHRAFELTR